MKSILGAFFLSLVSFSAFGQDDRPCLPYDVMVGRLAQGHYLREWSGLLENGMLAELYINSETLEWGFVFSPPDGPSCLVAQGTASAPEKGFNI